MLILYHKHPTSAWTRFLRLAHGGICDTGRIPPEAELAPPPKLSTHPAMPLRSAAERLGLTADELVPDVGFRCGLRVGDAVEQVHLGHFVGIDPPFAAAAAVNAEFIDLVQARKVLVPAELALLRLVYNHALGTAARFLLDYGG